MATTLLLAMAAGTLAYALLNSNPCVPAVAMRGVAAKAPDDGVVVYYFHINVRCSTCQAMEDFSRELIMDRFGSHVLSGSLTWMPVNVQVPENRHYLGDFRALTRSLVLERRKGGRSIEHRVLHEAWLHIYDRQEFEDYLSAEIRQVLAAAD
ncbi:MAG: hypothetical protein KIT83_00740 [Bryobacterales bacterium]|nr:hypothetical protein [Bryobacterales bacterium]